MASRGVGQEVAVWPSELREARRSAGLTQGALGRLVSVSAATVGGYELGKWSPPADVRAALEGVLESYWPVRGTGGANVSEQQEQDLSAEEMAGVEELQEELQEAVAEAEIEAEEAEAEAVAEVAELEAIATLADELRQRTFGAGRRAGRATAVEAELLLGPGLAEVYRRAFMEGLEEPAG